MELSANTILITGGASGIGLALAERLLAAGNEIIICGRREDKLQAARAAHPHITTRVCDVANADERVALAEWARQEHPRLNVLVNNAGIQRRVQLAEQEDWARAAEEIAINLAAPIHLSRLFIPHLARQPLAAILNVTSGLGFVPMASVPVYCATKAAMHSFTTSLRHQLANTPVEVIEIIPPAVDTDLGGPGLHTFGVALSEYADAVMAGLARGDVEIVYGFSKESSQATREGQAAIFARMNQARH